MKIFQFLWVFEFLNTLKNRTSKVRSTKTSTKQNLKKKHAINWKQCHERIMYDMMHEPMTLNIGSINAWT